MREMNDRNLESLLRTLELGDNLTHEEMSTVARMLRSYKADAERYKWLNKYTAQLFMVTEKQLNEQVDKAMNGGRE
jgi:threonine dehydratase